MPDTDQVQCQGSTGRPVHPSLKPYIAVKINVYIPVQEYRKENIYDGKMQRPHVRRAAY